MTSSKTGKNRNVDITKNGGIQEVGAQVVRKRKELEELQLSLALALSFN